MDNNLILHNQEITINHCSNWNQKLFTSCCFLKLFEYILISHLEKNVWILATLCRPLLNLKSFTKVFTEAAENSVFIQTLIWISIDSRVHHIIARQAALSHQHQFNEVWKSRNMCSATCYWLLQVASKKEFTSIQRLEPHLFKRYEYL